MSNGLTKINRIGYGTRELAKSSSGIGVPKSPGGHTASFYGGFFVSVVRLVFGRAEWGAFGLAGYLVTGTPTHSVPSIFFGVKMAENF